MTYFNSYDIKVKQNPTKFSVGLVIFMLNLKGLKILTFDFILEKT